MLREATIWKMLASWLASAPQYASAVQLWGEAASCAAVRPWPPSAEVLEIFTFLFKHGPSLSRYISHVRSALRLLNASLGVLDDTSALKRSTGKWLTNTYRFKPRATAAQVKALAGVVRSLG